MNIRTLISLWSLTQEHTLPGASVLKEALYKGVQLIFLSMLGAFLAAVLGLGVLYGVYILLKMTGMVPWMAAVLVALGCAGGLWLVYRWVMGCVLHLSGMPQNFISENQSPLSPLTRKVSTVAGAFFNGLFSGSRRAP